RREATSKEQMVFQIVMLSKIMTLSYSTDLHGIILNHYRTREKQLSTTNQMQVNSPLIFYNNYPLIGGRSRFHCDHHLIFANIECHQARNLLNKSIQNLHRFLCILHTFSLTNNLDNLVASHISYESFQKCIFLIH